MSLRLVELHVDDEHRETLLSRLRDEDDAPGRCVDVSCLPLQEEGRSLVRCLVPTERSEEILDLAVELLGSQARIVVSAVEATLPRVEEDEGRDDEASSEADGSDEDEPRVFARISREELYNDIAGAARLRPSFVVMVLLSAVVAAIGLLEDDGAVIIGAMVIAPLLGPNMALALGSTLGDLSLVGRALKVNAAGVAVALVPSLVAGYFLYPETPGPQLAARSTADVLDLVLALAAGGAGALSFTLGVPAALVGVMVAVALLPPLTVAGMAAGAGDWNAAIGAILLTAGNVLCVNLSAVVTFLVQGIRPAHWWEAKRARRSARIALLVWTVLIGALLAILLWAR